MPAIRIGKFQILGTLGKGAHSTILHIRRSEDSTNYALKVVPVEGKEDHKFLVQARHEFAVAQKLDHPNLIKIHALETQRDWLFRVRKAQLLIEYVNGKTLDTFQRIPMPKLVQVFQRVASGMQHMHERGVYHADMKPNNILLSRAGEVKVIDYGLAWIRGVAKGRVQGTPEYMAPEQIKHSMVNDRTDIFNFGATMYRLVSWRPPLNLVAAAENGLQMSARAYEKMLKPVKECNAEAPPTLCELIHACMAWDAHKRPTSMKELFAELSFLVKKLVRSPEDKLEMLQW
jgi:serine/threonine protein kinase